MNTNTLRILLGVILLTAMHAAIYADQPNGSRSKMDNSATGARGGDAGSSAGISPSTSNAPSSTGQSGDNGAPSTGYGNTDPGPADASPPPTSHSTTGEAVGPSPIKRK